MRRSFDQFLEAESHPKSLADFCKKRRDGAAAVAEKSVAKGGPATLTAWHFKAKLPLYDEIVEKIEKGESLGYLKSRFQGILDQLSLGKLSQRKYQELTGMLEVFGEVFIEAGESPIRSNSSTT